MTLDDDARRGRMADRLGREPSATPGRGPAEAHAYLAAIVASSNDAIIGKDLDGIITSWNPAAQRLYGYAPEEIVGRSIATIVPPERPDELPGIMARLVRGERIEHFETVRVRKDGTRVEVSVSISPILADSGRIVGAASIARDITAERRLAREQAERAADRTARLQALAESLATALTPEAVAHAARRSSALGAESSRLYLRAEDGTLAEAPGPGDGGEANGPAPAGGRAAPPSVAEAFRTGRPVIVAAGETPSSAPSSAPEHPGALRRISEATFPVTGPEGVLGVMTLCFDRPRRFDAEDGTFLTAVGRLVGHAIERARLYQAERAAREQLDTILDGVADGVVVQDAAGRFIYANAAAARLAGFATVEEYLGASTFEVSRRLTVLDAEGRPFSYDLLPARRALRGEQAPEMVVQFRRSDTGEVRTSRTRARSVTGLRGERLAISIFHDITEEARSEVRLRFLADAGDLLTGSLDVGATLAAVTRIASTTLADWSVAVLVGDDGQIERTESAHRDPAMDELVREIGARYPLRPNDGSVLWRVAAGGEPVLASVVTPEMIERSTRDPEHRALVERLGISSVMYLPLVARGRALGALGLFATTSGRHFDADDLAIAQEVAARAALALDNARLYRQAREAVAARDEFLLIASHELRTPVTAISGVAQLLERSRRRGNLDDARLARALEQIRTGSRRLVALTEDLLDVSRLQTGRFEVRPERLDLAAFVRDVVDRYHPQLAQEHAVTVRAADGACAVAADPARIEQVLANLLSNAAKYSPDGGPIDVRVEPDGAGVRLDVRDRGIGLPPGAEADLFRPFGRASNAALHQIQGLGLGLYICRQIVERHGGTIRATSAGEGRGTVFSVWLPCAPA